MELQRLLKEAVPLGTSYEPVDPATTAHLANAGLPVPATS